MVMTDRRGERGETVMFCYLYNSSVSLPLLSPSKTHLVLYLSRCKP